MITFHPILPSDKSLITSYTLSGEYRDNNLSICNLCSWHFLSESSYAIVNHQLLIRFRDREGNSIYTLPFGKGDTGTTLQLLYQEVRANSQPFLFFGPNPYLREQLEKYFQGTFEYTCPRDHFDYLYLREALSGLKGKDYQPKRNHANRFRKKYIYTYTPLSPEILPHCLELARKWCEKHNCEEDRNLQSEQQAMQFAMEHFVTLGLSGGALWINQEIVAFTYGAPINYDTFCVHIEKADTNFDGAYTVINQEFASHIPPSFLYINREEDLGIHGLRKAKLSYSPVLLLEKCRAFLLEI